MVLLGLYLLQLLIQQVLVGIGGCFSSNRRDIEVFERPRKVDVTTETYILQPNRLPEVYSFKEFFSFKVNVIQRHKSVLSIDHALFSRKQIYL